MQTFSELCEEYQPFVVTNGEPPSTSFDLKHYDVQSQAGYDIIQKIISFDNEAYSDNMGMKDWVAFDILAQTQGIYGLEDTDKQTDTELDDHDDPVPVAIYAACVNDIGTPIGNTCASIISREGLGLAAKIIGLEAMNAESIEAITSLDNHAALHAYSTIAPMKITYFYDHGSGDLSFHYEQDLPADLSKTYHHKPPKTWNKAIDVGEDLNDLKQLVASKTSIYITYPGVTSNGFLTLSSDSTAKDKTMNIH